MLATRGADQSSGSYATFLQGLPHGVSGHVTLSRFVITTHGWTAMAMGMATSLATLKWTPKKSENKAYQQAWCSHLPCPHSLHALELAASLRLSHGREGDILRSVYPCVPDGTDVFYLGLPS